MQHLLTNRIKVKLSLHMGTNTVWADITLMARNGPVNARLISGMYTNHRTFFDRPSGFREDLWILYL